MDECVQTCNYVHIIVHVPIDPVPSMMADTVAFARLLSFKLLCVLLQRQQ